MKDNTNIEEDAKPYLEIQTRIRTSVITTDSFGPIRYVAGADVAYNDATNTAIAAIVVLDATTLEIVDRATHEMDITFPYVPGLFSFREVPPLIGAYEKLTTKPDLIVCDGHGQAHPKGAGMASHLGVKLNVPTIGCAKTRLTGQVQPVGEARGNYGSILLDGAEIGRALRTQDGIKPMFVSVGHRITLDTACDWVLKLCPQYRQPETTRTSDQLVRQKMKELTEREHEE